jgi:cytochrome c-type biogenesis protein CcmH
MRLRARIAAATFALLVVAGSAFAVLPDEKLSDPKLEARAAALSQRLRCVVCQNQNIDDSAAPLARDMRLLVRERIVAGDTDAEVTGYLVARYGNFVLLKPPFQPDTWALWLGPFLIGGLACAGLYAFSRGRAAAAPAPPLSADEHARLAELLGPTASPAARTDAGHTDKDV